MRLEQHCAFFFTLFVLSEVKSLDPCWRGEASRRPTVIDPPTFSLLWQVYTSHMVWKVKLYCEEDIKVL